MRKQLKILFTISVLANVLLLGSLAGVIMDRPNDMPWDKVKEGLSPESQKLVTDMFQNTWKDMGSTMRQSMDNRKYLADVVRAEEFDAKKFDEAVARIKGVQDLMTKKKVESAKALLMKLPKEDRQKLAEQVANSFTWKGRKHDHPRPEEKAPPPSPQE